MKMRKIKVSEASGLSLDRLVAQALGHGPVLNMESHGRTWKGCWESTPQPPCSREYQQVQRYTTDWSHGGPIIERELLSPDPLLDTNCHLIRWRCRNWKGDGSDYYGATPLIAAMRCYVVSKLGEEVEIPEELD